MASKTKLATGVDLGSGNTRAVICAVEDESLRFLGYGEAPVHAWSKSRVTDQAALTASIRAAMQEAEARAQVSVEAAVIGVGGSVVAAIFVKVVPAILQTWDVSTDLLTIAFGIGVIQTMLKSPAGVAGQLRQDLGRLTKRFDRGRRSR